jgi:hypothetical protein
LLRNDARKYNIIERRLSDSPLNVVSLLSIQNANQYDDQGFYECKVRVKNQQEDLSFELLYDNQRKKNFMFNSIFILSLN